MVLTNIITPMDEYGQIYNDIHTQAVKEAICTQPPNPVIQTQPLVVDPVEKNLPRSHQTALSQLRSGCCKALSSYQNRINPSINPACPECGNGNHSPLIISSIASPMLPNLTPVTSGSHFVSSLHCFYYLPPLPPPPKVTQSSGPLIKKIPYSQNT